MYKVGLIVRKQRDWGRGEQVSISAQFRFKSKLGSLFTKIQKMSGLNIEPIDKYGLSQKDRPKTLFAKVRIV